MAKIKPEKASEKMTITEFGGIRKTSALTNACASEMRNFRISSDGSLEKRTGTKTLFSLGTPIRGLWQGSLDGNDYLMAVAGVFAYVRLPGETALTPRKQLYSAEGSSSFLIYHGTLFLFDGNDIYRFSTISNNFYSVNGYAPLYGVGWHPTDLGPVNEPLNAISAMIRISYDNSIGATTFRLPFPAISLTRVEVDGVQITPTFTTRTTTFSIPSEHAHGTLTVSMMLIYSYNYRSMVAPLSESLLFSGERPTVILYGGRQGKQIAYTAPVSDEMLEESSRFFPTVTEDHLYFPLENIFSLADSSHPINAVFRDRNRVIAMNDLAAWALEFSDDKLISYPLEGGVGCSSRHGCTLCGEQPVTIQSGGIFLLRFPSGESDRCISECISREIIELLPPSIFQSGILAWYPGRDELWMRDPTEEEEGVVWVYKRDKKEWYCFDNLYITDFFEVEGTVGFGTADGDLILPDETCYTDSGEPVKALYRSQFLAFSSPETCKRAIRTTVCADTGGQQLTIITQTDSRSRPFTASNLHTDTPLFFEYSMNVGRFRFLRFLFSVTGDSSARIYRLSMLANP